MEESIIIGKKVKHRRELLGLTEKQFADFLGVEQEYLRQRESGKENFSVILLENACNLFGCDILDIVEEKQNTNSIKIAFRASNLGTADLVAISKINKIALNLDQMNQWLGNMKQNSELNSDAVKLREKLNISLTAPIDDIFSLIENSENFTLIFYPFSNNISGMSVKIGIEKLIVINSANTLGRQHFTAAHELYHLFVKEEDLVICENMDWEQKTESEKEADIFASYFLAPENSLKEYIEKTITPKNNTLMPEDVVKIEQYFKMSRKAILTRLQNEYNIENREKLESNVKSFARSLGYEDLLYCPNTEKQKYYTAGNYIKKVEEVREKEIVSAGKYKELLNDAFRYDQIAETDETQQESEIFD
ncbi:hypothetical protein MmiHf6_11360 [Methanimicrococcus hongohii]|uniref:HTH cro/C1-type domain-containing protein n=1 Tax=Methanimicrococcus hongohii TaxID=3028295 RepID=A0AA96V0T2_9EURY|nr:XRE family transcriptional regulator [Methanimicrococcus sp. Hf6]WNY23815.1 hypothetical protein MmiHf6_11360 [Methanimicrococcus sp. Hf6]